MSPALICSNEDRAQHRFKNEWTLVRLFLINHALLLSARSKSRGEAWRCVVKNVMPQLFLSTGFSNPFLNVKILRGLSLITMTS